MDRREPVSERHLGGDQAKLSQSPEPMPEEWGIHDYEDFGGTRIDEHESIEDVVRLAARHRL